MKKRRGIGIGFLAGGIALLGFASMGHATSAVYGGRTSNFILLPWFEVSNNQNLATSQNVLPVITNLTTAAEFDHIRIFDVDSHEACNVCVPVTPEDVDVESLSDIIQHICSSGGRTALDPTNSGTFRGYATFEPNSDSACTKAIITTSFPGTGATTGVHVGNFYVVQLNQGLASGINGPGYDTTVAPVGLQTFPLATGERLYFRFLVALGGNPSAAATAIVIWSATTGNCAITGGAVVPDSNCLSGLSSNGALRVCDESEACTSQALPPLPHEVNIFLADNVVPGSFATGGGYFRLINPVQPAVNGTGTVPAGFTLTAGNLNVLGYADNRANSANTANLNWEAIFPAQRETN